MSRWTAETVPWSLIAGPLAAAEDAVARLDERLLHSPIRDGWISRVDFQDACDSIWLTGELVHVEDLVLHNERMDIRIPTHEVTRAHAVLRARRRIMSASPEWALSDAGVDVLRGRLAGAQADGQGRAVISSDDDEDNGDDHIPENMLEDDNADDAFDLVDEFAELDRALARTQKLLSSGKPARDHFVYDADWDEDKKLGEWRAVMDRTDDLPPVLAAAIAIDAWEQIDPLQHLHWLGPLLAAAQLRKRGKARVHLPCPSSGLRAMPLERRRARDRNERLKALIESFAAGAAKGLQDHDRWLLARRLLERKLARRRSTSKLPALIDYVITRPIVSAGMIAKELAITPRAAQDLVAELGLREATGKRRYRAWGII